MTDNFIEHKTHFRSEDAPPLTRVDGSETYRNQYNRLSVWNRLEHNGKWRDETRATEKDHNAVLGAVAGQLSLTDYQQQRAKYIFQQLPDGVAGQGYPIEVIALCACGIAGREDGREYHPNKLHPSSSVSNEFVDIADSIGAPYKQVYSCWTSLTQKL